MTVQLPAGRPALPCWCQCKKEELVRAALSSTGAGVEWNKGREGLLLGWGRAERDWLIGSWDGMDL